MKKIVVVFISLLILSCSMNKDSRASEEKVEKEWILNDLCRVVDKKMGVVCYMTQTYGIFCVPLSLTNPKR